MTDNSRTADQIERDINNERAALSDTINDLQDKFSVKAIFNDVSDMFRIQGGDLGRNISDTVSRNPAAVVLTTVGLAWLFLGQGNTPMRQQRSTSDYDWYNADRLAGENRRSGEGNTSETMMHKVRDRAAHMGEAASDLTDRLSLGLEHLSEDAKSRVLAARRAAHDARDASKEAMQKGSKAATGFFDDQPLVVGALALAVGAAIGGLLPHSKIEDDTMGAASDELYANAQAIYREERDKAIALAKVAADDVKSELKDVGTDLEGLLPDDKNVGEVIADRTSDAAKRVIGHATEVADGTPKGDGNTQA
ncbi:MAG: DUF3618 domain-containing protein [Loktanella sp.]|nr:DUF3618 domain-containing protein [Loktanella sp.]